jgi:hypothetical protein
MSTMEYETENGRRYDGMSSSSRNLANDGDGDRDARGCADINLS